MVLVCYDKDGDELPYVTVKWFATLAEAHVELKVLAYATLLMRQVDDQYNDYAASSSTCDEVKDSVCCVYINRKFTQKPDQNAFLATEYKSCFVLVLSSPE